MSHFSEYTLCPNEENQQSITKVYSVLPVAREHTQIKFEAIASMCFQDGAQNLWILPKWLV